MQDASTLPGAPAQLSDRDLVDTVVAAITPPKVTASSSFVLHAPMELIARARLLRLAPPAARPEGRRRIAALTRLRDALSSCIGCGCLSLDTCALYNPADGARRRGPGPRYLLGDTPASVMAEATGLE